MNVDLGWLKGLLRNVTGTGTGELVSVNEESSVGITRVD